MQKLKTTIIIAKTNIMKKHLTEIDVPPVLMDRLQPFDLIHRHDSRSTSFYSLSFILRMRCANNSFFLCWEKKHIDLTTAVPHHHIPEKVVHGHNHQPSTSRRQNPSK